MTTKPEKLIVRDLGLQEYETIWQAMQKFTAERDETTADELWCLEHPPIFTMGLNGKKEHLLNIKNIPVIDIDRGGQVTYHGPGQLVIYTLIDLKRLNIGVKDLVSTIEKSIIQLLKKHEINAKGKENAPGVYVNNAKIAALGLRIKKNKSYHGLSLNIQMDLTPFQQINPCGYEGMEVTQIKDLKPASNLSNIKKDLSLLLSQLLGYDEHSIIYANKEKDV
ncbi:MAG: lipoyl(octanoyl) transferase LipB [Gammaproteobacteria bacterium]|nr:lipoyl(octanoyl) transferase LipB [Gammaproteobacteria bacterium]MDH5661055.1 lipoyl(octanoyl) transferase LipB [Gammaproteobacteria bacterium]